MEDFLTIEVFATFAGMILFITALTQAIKYFVPWTISPKIYTLVLSIVANVARLVFITKVYTPESIFLMIINIFVVAFAASGGYEYIVKPIQKTIEDKKTNI